MKSLKRVTALALTFAMIVTSLFSMCAFADTTLTDVADDNPNSAAIRALVTKGVITGYEDGTFKPDNTITRAEFATILARATAGSVTLTATTAKFPDVALDYWANTYIAYAVSTGTVNGYEDGTFRPENPVSYGEAVKMLVCSLGYSNVVAVTEPWYEGYITVAGQIGLTKNAGGTGDTPASRGTIAQLVYDMGFCKKLVQTGTDSSGKPTYSTKSDDEDYEVDSGVVTAVFEDSLTGENFGLNKQQIMLNNTVYNIGDLSIDSFYAYLGKNIDIDYEDGAKKVIVDFEEVGNTSVTVKDTMIEDVSGRSFEYYENDDDKKSKTLKLSDKLNVVYNGKGVPLAQIDDTFIEKYLDVSTGEITFVNNSGGSSYDVAFVTSYDTYYVSGTTTTDDSIKIIDSYAGKDITLTKNDCTFYRVSSSGGSKTEATVSAVVKNTVVSIAVPYNSTENTEVIISTVKLSGKKVTGTKRDTIEIANTTYDYSDYYSDLLNADSKYSVSLGDTATFYLDYKDRIVYVSKTETTDPYAYLISIDTGSGLSGDCRVKLMTASGSTSSNYYLNDKVKINGTTYSRSEAVTKLTESAGIINNGKISKVTENATYAQLIKYQTTTSDGKTRLSDITTVTTDPDEYINVGKISDGKTMYTYNETGKIFDSGSDKFIVNSSTLIFCVPNNRNENESDSYKKVSTGNLTNGAKYVVEAYDISSNIAKVVIMYDAATAIKAKITDSQNCILVENCTDGAKDTNNDDKIVKELKYYEAGSTTLKTMLTKEADTLSGVSAGDIIRIATEGSGDDSRVVGYQKVYVGGELYDYSSLAYPFDTFKASDNYIVHASGSTKNYYRVIVGTLASEDTKDGSITIVPQIVTNDDDFDATSWTIDTTAKIDSSTKYYKWDATNEVFKTNETDSEISSVTSADKVNPTSATKLVAVVLGGKVKAVYRID